MTGRHRPHEGSTARELTALALGLLTLVTVSMTLAGVDTPARLYLTVAFVLTAPGWAVTAYLRLREPALVWSVSVSVGTALAIVLAQTMVSTGFWHPWAAMLALELGTAGILGHHLLRWRHRGPLLPFKAAR